MAWTCLVKPINYLIPTISSLSSTHREIFKSSLTGEAINKKLCDKVLKTRHSRVLHQTALLISIYFGKRVGETQNGREVKNTDIHDQFEAWAVFQLIMWFRLSLCSSDCASLCIGAGKFEANKQNWHFSDSSCFSLIITWVIILNQLFASGSVNIGGYSPQRIFTNIYFAFGE